MALRARQEQQLLLAIALFLESKYPEAHRAFEREAHIDFSAVSTALRGEEKFDSETLPKRWAATARMQARLTVLQHQIQQQEQQLSLFASAATGSRSKKAAGLPSPKASCVLSAQRQPVNSCVFHPLLPQLLAGADDGNIRVISLEGNSIAAISRTFRAHHASVTGLAFDPSGRWLVSSSSDMTLRLFDVQSSYTLKETLRGHEDSVSAVVFSAIGKNNTSGPTNHLNARAVLNGEASEVPVNAAASSGSLCIISCSRDGCVKLWDANSGLCLQTFAASDAAGSWAGSGTGAAGVSWVRCVCVPEERLRPAQFFASAGNDQRQVGGSLCV
ncbi:hypothetical protein Emag_002578 [Eimeria magna]